MPGHWSSVAALREWLGGTEWLPGLDLGLLSLRFGFPWQKKTTLHRSFPLERWKLCVWGLVSFLGVVQAAVGAGLMVSDRNIVKQHISWDTTFKQRLRQVYSCLIPAPSNLILLKIFSNTTIYALGALTWPMHKIQTWGEAGRSHQLLLHASHFFPPNSLAHSFAACEHLLQGEYKAGVSSHSSFLPVAANASTIHAMWLENISELWSS